MRVITGSARGRNLDTLSGDEVTRPTSQSTKEAMFSSIQFELEGKRVLDLFAGSGQMGIEAISRGAKSCVFVESNKDAFEIVCRNVKKCGFENQSDLIRSDARTYLTRGNTFDVCFLDPPYASTLVEECLPLVVENMNDGGVIICETQSNKSLPNEIGVFKISKEKKYGKAKLTYYREV